MAPTSTINPPSISAPAYRRGTAHRAAAPVWRFHRATAFVQAWLAEPVHMSRATYIGIPVVVLSIVTTVALFTWAVLR